MSEGRDISTVTGRLFPLVVTQALSAFNNNQLRGAMLTLVGFGKLKAFGLAPESIVALSTLLIVTPIFLLSLFAGQLGDRISKARLIRVCKLVELGVFIVVAIALVTKNGELLLAGLLLAGLETAFFGPAKLGILPELVASERLIEANAWMGATSTLSILFGLIVGSLLLFLPNGATLVAGMGVVIAVLGLVAALSIRRREASAPETSEPRRGLAGDLSDIRRLCRDVPVLRLPLIGRSWFWYQAVITTSLMPLLPGAMPGQSPAFTTLIFIVTAAGVCLGALLSRFLAAIRGYDLAVLSALFVSIALPSVDIPFSVDANQPLRLLADIFVLSAGTGLFLVVLNTVVQSETPDTFRARLIGAGDTLSGLAMMLSGVTIAGLEALSVPMPNMFLIVGVLTALIAAATVRPALPALSSIGQAKRAGTKSSKLFTPADL